MAHPIIHATFTPPCNHAPAAPPMRAALPVPVLAPTSYGELDVAHAQPKGAALCAQLLLFHFPPSCFFIRRVYRCTGMMSCMCSYRLHRTPWL